MQFSFSFGSAAPPAGRFKVGAAGSGLSAGQAVIWLSAQEGTVEDPAAATDLTNCFGVTTGTATYSTTQGAGNEGIAEVIYDPMAVFEARVVPSATAGTDYAEADGYLLTVDVANAGGLQAADSDLGGSDADLNDGLIFCTRGLNKGQSRIVTDWDVPNTRATVTVPFDYAISLNDVFVASPFAPGVIALQMTTDFTEANGTIAGATGGEAVTVGVRCETAQGGATPTAPHVFVEWIAQDHAFNHIA